MRLSSMSEYQDRSAESVGKWPSFLVVGAPKAGTTSIYFYLRQHPEVFMSPVKEPHYFSVTEKSNAGSPRMDGVTVTREEYLALFSGVDGEIAIGEASTGYLISPVAAQRIRAKIPSVKIIVILRNPAERAFSGYMMKIRNSREYSSVADAFHRGKAYIENSFYEKNLTRYFDVFPREQIGIFLFEEFKKDPLEVMRRIYKFIGVNEAFTPSTNKYNEAWFPKYPFLNRLRTQVLKSRKIHRALKGTSAQRIFRRLTRTDPPVFPAALRQELIDLYREDIVKTQGLTDIDLSLWLDNEDGRNPALASQDI